jgi:transposase
MTPISPLPDDLFASLARPVQVYIRSLEEIAAQVAGLRDRIQDLEARLNRDSSNSSRPPSSDPPHVKPAPPKAPTGRKRGGQPGHRRHARPDLPPDTIIDIRPDVCTRCSSPLSGDDPAPVRLQVVEIPPVRPHVTEYRRHRLPCPACGRVACPALPPGVSGGYGPRVQAVCALLAGAYRVGKRGVARLCGDLFGVPISPAGVCDLQRRTAAALEPVVHEAHAYVAGRPANVDETGWREGRARGWLWVAVTASVTVFLIRLSRGRKVLAELIGGEPGVLTTDRYSAYGHLPADQRQVCWAHLRRDFQAMIDRRNAGSGIGEDLLMYADFLLCHWKRVRDGTLTRLGYRRYYLGCIRAEVRALLLRGTGCGCAITVGVCRELLSVEQSLYTFAAADGVEPTNNAAERALRHAVCWRKTSYGTDSASGSRFVERVLTVVASCRQQERDALEYLVRCCESALTGGRPPSLCPASPGWVGRLTQCTSGIGGETMQFSKSVGEFCRRRAVELIDQGESKEVVLRVLGVSRTTLNIWLQKSRAGEDLAVKTSPGRTPRLDDEKLRRLAELLKQGPEAHGWRNNLWTSLRVREVIKRHFGVVFCRSQVWRILKHHLRWTAKRPVQQQKKRDDKKVAVWVSEKFPAILGEVVRRKATLVFIDETGFMMYPTIRKSFSPRGEPPVNLVTNPHGRISTIGAISFRPADGHLGWHYAMLDDNNNFRGPGVVAFLRQLAAAVQGPMTIVWDQIIIHSCGVVNEYLTTNPSIELEPFPPYAPELNPVDRAWFYIKYDRIPNLTPSTTAQLRRSAETELKRIGRTPTLLRSFIRHSALPLTLGGQQPVWRK